MKRSCLSVLLLLVVTPLFAEHVDPETARKAATTFLSNNGAKTNQLTDLSKAAGFTNLYIFNGNPGFVVMAADDCVKPILGYSLDNPFVVEDMPENISSWLQGYNDQIQYAIDNQLRANDESAKMWKELAEGNLKAGKATTVVNALVQTKWNQNGYKYNGKPLTLFNNLCPTVPSGGHGGRAYTGCVATAMAQIMKYWDYPSKGIGSHSYLWNNETLGADFGSTTYDWAHMTNKYSHISTDEEKYAVDVLMYHCGVSVNMSYGGSGSSASTYDVMYALQTYFNYSPNMHYEVKKKYSNDEWIAMLKIELDEGRPLQYRGSSTRSGHSFVCDGYDSENNFHFNWGWAGSCDGYYSLDDLTTTDPGTGGGNGTYTFNQEAIFGIQPVQCAAAAPILEYDITGSRDLTLTWNAAENAVSYNVYRNGLVIGNTGSTTYSETAPFGKNNYYVRSMDSNGNLSLSSNYATVGIEYLKPAVNDLNATFSETNASLTWTAPEWCYPESPSVTLNYGDGDLYYSWTCTYYGHRHPAADMAAYSNMVMYKVSSFIEYAGTYSVYVFTGTANEQPKNLVFSKEDIDIPFQLFWLDIDLDTPLSLSGNDDLWIIMKQANTGEDYPVPSFNLSSYNANACYGGDSLNSLSSAPSEYQISWFINAYLTDGTYTYNLYQDSLQIANGLTSPAYTVPLNDNAANQLVVKTNYYGGEVASNMVGYTKGGATADNLKLKAGDNLTVPNGSTLTLTGTIDNDDPARLIIEDGGQLIHPSKPVNATLKKPIHAYSTETGVNNGWYTIASPVDEYNVASITTGSYDLYAYDEENALWLNQKKPANNITQFEEGKGFLYANADEQTLGFAGNMKATDEQVIVLLNRHDGNKGLNGFNLAGNPYTRNLHFGELTLGGIALTTYYSVEGGSELVSHNIDTDPIRPGQGFLVQASEDGQNLVFNPTTSKDQVEEKPSYICIEAGDESFFDRSYVQFGKGNILHKMTLDDNTAKLSIMRNHDSYATVTVNADENELPLHFKAIHDGTHTLSVNIVNIELDYLHLIDHLTGADIDLLQNPSYSFEAQTDDYASRFKLVFDPSGNTGEIGNNFVEGKSVVIDMMGRVVATEANTKLAPGVYLLRTVNGNDTKTEKIIIK